MRMGIVTVSPRTTGEDPFSRCVSGVIYSMEFPAPPDQVRVPVYYPLRIRVEKPYRKHVQAKKFKANKKKKTLGHGSGKHLKKKTKLTARGKKKGKLIRHASGKKKQTKRGRNLAVSSASFLNAKQVQKKNSRKKSAQVRDPGHASR
jgi:hypothetical protein